MLVHVGYCANPEPGPGEERGTVYENWAFPRGINFVQFFLTCNYVIKASTLENYPQEGDSLSTSTSYEQLSHVRRMQNRFIRPLW